LDRGSNGLILRIGNRSSPNFYRVYEKKEGLEFEMELKKGNVVGFQEFLFSNQLEKFEGRLAEHFYNQSRKSLVLDSCYTDWRLIGLRKIVSN
jgi:hypothetical protein